MSPTPLILFVKIMRSFRKLLLLIPESNGVVERKNRTLKEIMNAMLVSSGTPLNLWGKTILSACHIQNRIPYKKIGKTPYELWKGYAPNIAYLEV